MTTNRLKNLVAQSYRNDILDTDKLYNIANRFTRSELKQYIDALKNHEDKKNIIVTMPFKAYSRKGFEKLFPNKKIFYKIDPSLMLGVKIVDNDNVYEFNLKSRLDDIISYITKRYD